MAAPTAQPPPRTVLRVAAISGSLRRASANTGLIRAAAEICRESIPGLQVDYVDISELPLLNTDLEADGGFPPAIEAFRDSVRRADCFLFASPEYNYSISGARLILLTVTPLEFFPSSSHVTVLEFFLLKLRVPLPGPLKNALDWGSRPPNCWADRAAAMLSASGSTGGSRSQYHIRQVGVFLDIHFINKPEVFTKAHLPPKKFDADGNLIDSETKEQVRKMLLSLQAFALRLQGKSADSV
uniref:NAD(P)H dehydrogenase (quinone) n=1 Tax=Aegilops tauschii subsp. strangulata TaxID=200361 RepID=A0A453MUF4_AEGTS